jgi:transglutaminase-like putative cysteine protease
VWSAARKIGFTATGLAVVVPILVPTWSVGLFDGNGPGGGGGDAVSINNPIVNMRRDLNRGLDVDLVRVVTDDPDPRYLRVSVLDQFDGETWKPSNRSIPIDQRADGLVPRPPGLGAEVQSTTYKWDVELTGNFSSTWLPAPYPVYSLTAPGDWRYNRDTLDFVSGAKDQPSQGLRYQLERIDVNPTAEQLAFAAPAPATIFGPGTDLPDGIPDSVKALAQSVTDQARTKYEKAVALQDWFRTGGGFEYSLDPAPGNGVDALMRFLDERIGYCEQFAGAMALMGRELAIPSRVAVGFLRPDPVGDQGTYVYSAHDLHAWPEMYFEGVGWVRFEPTPGVRSGRAPAYTQERVDRTQPSASSSASALLPTGQNRIDRSSAPAAGGSDSGGSVWSTPAMLGGALGMLLLLGLLALPRTARSWVRSRRWAAATTTAGAAEAGWAELRDTALDLNLAFDDRRTVRAVARELVRSFGVPGADDDALSGAAQRGPGANPDAEAALRRVIEHVERARFARDLPVGADQAAAVRDDVERCVEAMQAGVGRRRRARATWVPASLWSRWRPLGTPRRSVRTDVLTEPGVDHAT